MARSAVAAGYDVTVYARWEPGLPLTDESDDYRIVRIVSNWQLAIPGLRWRGRRAVAARLRNADAGTRPQRRVVTVNSPVDPEAAARRTPARRGQYVRSWIPDWMRGTPLSPTVRRMRRLRRRRRPKVPKPNQLLLFPLRPMGWAVALDAVAEPADIWHGMWAGSLPALGRLGRRHGGRTIYDSRDVYMHARAFDRMHPVRRWVFMALERRWAKAADAVLTVNDAYADILERTLGIDRPAVVMNCPERWDPPVPPPDRIREALKLPADAEVALYQGNLTSDRGIEQAMEAILEVPDARLVLMGYGARAEQYRKRSAEPPYAGRVFLVPPVPPSELLEWTASASLLVITIQPTSLNHRHTTPQKLFEAMAAGIPVVASDLPGIRAVVSEARCGVLCDPTSPSAIAAAIRELLAASPDARQAFRAAALMAAHDRYNWETEVGTLLEMYERLSRS